MSYKPEPVDQRPAAPEVGGTALPLLRLPAPGVVLSGVVLLRGAPVLLPAPVAASPAGLVPLDCAIGAVESAAWPCASRAAGEEVPVLGTVVVCASAGVSTAMPSAMAARQRFRLRFMESPE